MTTIVLVAALTYAIGNGGKTAKVVNAFGTNFVNSIKVITHPASS